MKYTEGEWEVVTYPDTPRLKGNYYIGTKELILAEVYEKADAQLIAQAPRMYEALKELTKKFTVQTEAEANAYKALAEAEGH